MRHYQKKKENKMSVDSESKEERKLTKQERKLPLKCIIAHAVIGIVNQTPEIYSIGKYNKYTEYK